MAGSNLPPSLTSEARNPFAISPSGDRAGDAADNSHRASEVLNQQTATAEILEIINRASGDLAPVFDAILDKSTSLCGAAFGILWLRVGDRFQPSAVHGVPEPFVEYLAAEPTHPGEPGTGLGRIAAGDAFVHLVDPASTEAYRTGSSILRRAFVDLGGTRTLLTVALRKDGVLLGALSIYRQEVRPFSDRQIALVTNFATQAVIAIENARLMDELRQRTKELTQSLEYQAATSDVLKVISRSTSDLQLVLDTVAKTAARLCGSDTGNIVLREGEVYRYVSMSTSAANPEYFAAMRQRRIVPGRDSVAGRVALEGKVVQVADILADPDYTLPEVITAGLRTILGVPLLRESEPIGMITLSRKRVEPFTARQIELVATFADQAVIAIGNARLMDELRARTEELASSVAELQALREVGQAVSSSLDQRTVLSTIVGLSIGLAGADAGAVYRYDAGERSFYLVEAVGWNEELVCSVGKLRIRESETGMGQAAANRSPLQLADLTERPSFPLRDAVLVAGFHSVLIVPLVGAGQVLGTIVLQRREAGEFPAETVRLMQTLASQSVLAIQNAGLFREIAEKNEELARASQHKSQFLATMSHEIRTPMNGVLGMLEVLEHQGLAEAQRPIVATMRDSAHALLRIIDDVLDFSKIEAGKLELEASAFSLSGLIEAAVETVRPQALGKGLEVAIAIEPASDDALVGDPTRVRQILLNLLSNAIKFTERGWVRINAGASRIGGGRSQVTIAVADSGIGLDALQQSRLFEPFAQADSSTTRRYGGSGLGLSIVRRLARLMDGEISVTSTRGVGSRFTVSFLLATAPADSPLNTLLSPETRAAAASAIRILPLSGQVLIVEDHPINAEVLLRQLALLGVAGDVCTDGAEALSAWAGGNYAAVLVDLHMPRMDGYELTNRLRAAEAERGGARTPLVAVTANATKGEEERCLAAGMDAYLTKPVTIERLRSTLERWLGEGAPDAAPELPQAGGAVDRSVLAAWVGNEPAAIDALLIKFRDSAFESREVIDAAWRAADLVGLAAAAHRLKGAARSVGANAFGHAAAALEEAGKAGDRERCRSLLGPFAVELRRISTEIPDRADG
jgi:signal transduction histidine kinase/DNA-binding response OmpR family regulator